MEDWKKKIVEKDGAATPIPDWMKRAMATDETATNVLEDAGPNAMDIDDSEDAPALIRLQVGALDKPEDRLAALRKHYPDAEPYEDGNFIYTDKSGKTRLYNQPNWLPFNAGDLASIAPEIGETAGSVGGGILGAFLGAGTGGATGAVAGSVVPGPGTVAGAAGGAGYGGFLGAVTGAGTGAVVGREATKDGLNWLFGNEDTRTLPEELKDVGQSFILGAAGEGIGRGIGYGLKATKDAFKTRVIGEPDDVAEVARRTEDWRKIGVEPTVGMVAGNTKTAKLEHALIPTRKGQVIQDRIDEAFEGQTNEFSRIVNGISDKPLSIAEAGEALRRQAELAKSAAKSTNDENYARVSEKITSPATVENTASLLKGLTEQRAGFGKFAQINESSQVDEAIRQASAIVEDAQGGGWSFEQLKKARSRIGSLKEDQTDPVLKSNLDSLYRSLTADLETTASASGPDALDAWKSANDTYTEYKSPEKGFGKGGAGYDLLKKNTDDIFNYAMSGNKNGGNRLAQVRRIVEKSEGGKEAWDQTVSGFIQRLGSNVVDGAEQYHPTLFMNQWTKNISKEAKDVLFAGTKGAQYRKDLDTLSRLADNWKTYNKSANHSNSQAHKSALESMNPLSSDNMLGTALGLAGTMATNSNPATALAGGVVKGGGTAAAKGLQSGKRVKLLTNPETVNWIAGIPKARMAKGGLKGHVKRLIQIGATTSDNALASAIDHYLKDLNFSDDE